VTDIVEELRQASLNQSDYRWEAADEIERLRAENERLRKALLKIAIVALEEESDE
jgi:hypothetical protein